MKTVRRHVLLALFAGLTAGSAQSVEVWDQELSFGVNGPKNWKTQASGSSRMRVSFAWQDDEKILICGVMVREFPDSRKMSQRVIDLVHNDRPVSANEAAANLRQVYPKIEVASVQLASFGGNRGRLARASDRLLSKAKGELLHLEHLIFLHLQGGQLYTMLCSAAHRSRAMAELMLQDERKVFESFFSSVHFARTGRFK